MWQDILTAVALYLVLEGMLPFISPDGFRRAVIHIARLGDNSLRVGGLTAMAAGLLLLFLVRA
ncbi:MAG: DUF2065 domain-containing protein [Gammaproteobacteria bacterium]|nr:DUF2065 domain-containing protein [Gammaproteobacteria bacterium]MDH4255150.1 DUF2065 domain-containing protein [Gammaproteobacteria bacterium]MDH5309426.1 DUF2065 domain-containing protein [Gammaproteobacteria bacterium]